MNRIALPDALLPWREWLSWFAPDLALEIGKMLRCLSPLLGRFHGQQLGGEPEPDGLDDLMRRGSYERLLSSEWLLAEDMPEEFLRRAADGEHVFLAPRPRAKQAEKRIVAIFDAGPMQLGAPRLAHIALWILLARRAQQVGGEFCWGIVQENTLHTSQDEHALKALLQGRCYDLAQAGHWQTWQDKIQALAEQPGECWLIGAVAPQSLSCFSHQVQLEPDLTGESLQASIVQELARRSMTLTLPAQSSAVALLQARFLPRQAEAAKQTETYSLSILRPPIISGNRVAVSLSDESSVVVYHLQQDKQQANKARRQSWKKDTLLALAFHEKQLGGLLAQQDKLRFWQVHGVECDGKLPEQFVMPTQHTNLLRMIWLKKSKQSLIYILDDAENLFGWLQAGYQTVQKKCWH